MGFGCFGARLGHDGGVGWDPLLLPEADASRCPSSVPVLRLGGGSALHGDPTCRMVSGKPVVRGSTLPVAAGEVVGLVHCQGLSGPWRDLAEFRQSRELCDDLNGCASRLWAGSPWAFDEVLERAPRVDDRVVEWVRALAGRAVDEGVLAPRMLEASFLRVAISRERFPTSGVDESVSGEMAAEAGSRVRALLKATNGLGPSRSVARAWCRNDFDEVAYFAATVFRAVGKHGAMRPPVGGFGSVVGLREEEIGLAVVSGFSAFVADALPGPRVTLDLGAGELRPLARSALAFVFGAPAPSGGVQVEVPETVASLARRAMGG